MYKETLDILMEDINDPIKETILKNQLKYHFLNKTPENKNVIDDSTVIVRRILSNFNIGKIIGVQPITDNKLSVISDGVEYDIKIDTRPLQTCKPGRFKDLNAYNGIDIECEINAAVASEVEIEITSELLKNMADNITNNLIVDASFTDLESIKNLVDVIKNEIKEVDANWIVVSPMALAMLQSDSKSRYKTSDEKHGMMGELLQVGWLDDDVTVYCGLWIDNIVLIGSKDPNTEDAPMVYAPETMMVVGEKIKKPNQDHTTLLTSGAIFVNIEAVKERYRKISIKFEN